MPKKYVCNPKTGRVIEVGLKTYRELSKNPAWKKKKTLVRKTIPKMILKKITTK